MVLEALSEHLATARREGQTFAEVWEAAVMGAVALATAAERAQWLTALTATRQAWEAGFERRDGTRTQRAVLLLDADEREAEDAVEGDRVAA